MKVEKRASPQVIFQRLLQRKEHLDRWLQAELDRYGLSLQVIARLPALLDGRPVEEIARRRRELERRLVPWGPDWDEVQRPSLLEMNGRRAGVMLRA